MTVEAYLRSLVIGLDINNDVLERAARSPKEVGLEALSLGADLDKSESEADFQMRLDYAASTVYYSVLGVFAGGGYSEKVGDVSKSRSGYTITQADRDRFKMLADRLRKKHGFEIEEDDDGGMFDATPLRRGWC